MKTVIIGGGLAGLAAANKLKKDYIILEKESRPGGLCRSEKINNFIFDYTGHFLHLRSSEVKNFIMKKLRLPLKKITRSARIYSHGVYTKYPYQQNNYGLPPEVIEENVAGFLEAKFGENKEPGNFKEWALSEFGRGIAGNFMIPYNEKLWKYPLDKLTLKWMGRFVPRASVDEVMEGILPDSEKQAGYNASFYYPIKGGIEELVKAFARDVEDKIKLNAPVKKIDTKTRTVYYEGGSIKYSRVISTAALKQTAGLSGIGKLHEKAGHLKAVSVYALNVGFKTADKQEMHWVYVPESRYPFYRIGFPSAVSHHCAPRGCGSVFAELSFRGIPPERINEKIISALVSMKIIRSKKDIVVKKPMILKDAYVIYDKEREKAVPAIIRGLEKKGIYTAGRWGRWEYSSMEDAIQEGFSIAEQINNSG